MIEDLNACDQTCFGCIKSYKKKHDLKKGQSFSVDCRGIPKDFVPLSVLSSLPPEEHQSAISMIDPVTWAANTLDWHCLDPDGEVWKRKNPEEYHNWVMEHPGQSVTGKSRYHRPWQAEVLRCSATRKVLRIGRQSGKSDVLVINILFNLFTKPSVPIGEGFKVVLITPFQSQIEVIFNRMKSIIQGANVLSNAIKRNVKAPVYTIELYNGSQVKGFTAGTKSGSNAGSVRGQTANMLAFDEADYLAPEDMEAALSIITNYPNAKVWMSSTPSGKRETFFRTCFSSQWKEYHYPSQCNPMWSDQLEFTFRESLTDIAYQHEILAEFGEQEEGVFQNSYVQAAKVPYKYGQYAYNSRWNYTVGVDWNDTKNGTTIAILGLDPDRNKFVLVDRYIVSKDGWTQLAACEKIAEVNRLWRPMAIYVDRGYGSTQYEVLRKFSLDSLRDPTKGPLHPDSKLVRVLKQYDFGSNIETRDIFSGAPVKKEAKPFLVESTVRRFENQDIEIPEDDDSLESQLLGYIIDRITPTGKPVYKASNKSVGDHLLDAIMLSVMAFVLEASPLGKPKYEVGVTFSGQFGEKTDPWIHQGDTVIHADTKHKAQQEKEQYAPNSSRSLSDRPSLIGTKGLPGSHLQSDSQIGLWDWPGFTRDQPKPRARSLGEAEGDARRNLGYSPLRGGKPRRRNF